MTTQCVNGSVSLFIPAYNAGGMLQRVIERIPDSVMGCLLGIHIVDDGSLDDTKERAYEIQRSNPIVRYTGFEKNSGYGAAVKRGLELCRKDGSDVSVCLHSDGQYPPEYIPEIAEFMLSRGYDIIQGSRIAYGSVLKKGMPVYKYVSGRVLSLLENMVFRNRMTDRHSGYMFYSRRALNLIDFENLSDSFDFDMEVLASSYSSGLSVSEYPVPARYSDEISYLNPVLYGFRVLRVLLKYMTGRYLQK
ncbi:MAG: glycosyltransferase family 2 protein [Chitinivibrionales bacterium]